MFVNSYKFAGGGERIALSLASAAAQPAQARQAGSTEGIGARGFPRHHQ